jgi:hypothetical protein
LACKSIKQGQNFEPGLNQFIFSRSDFSLLLTKNKKTMKNLIYGLSLALALGAILTFNSCKKETTEDDSVSAQDATIVNNAVNLTADDASATAGQVSSFSGKTEGLYQALCGATLVDSSNAHQITITYDPSQHCFGIERSGTVTFTLTNGPWRNAGAILNVTYNNLKVTDVLTGATYTISGTHTITNESGGFAWEIAYGLLTNATRTHRNQSSDMSVTFPNGSTRTWTVDRSRSWTSAVSNNVNTISVTTFCEATGGTTGVTISGTNRFGNQFTYAIASPVIGDNYGNCPYLPYTGEVTHQVGSRSATVLFGTNSSGVQIGTATTSTCNLGYFITYTNAANGHSGTKFVSY